MQAEAATQQVAAMDVDDSEAPASADDADAADDLAATRVNTESVALRTAGGGELHAAAPATAEGVGGRRGSEAASAAFDGVLIDGFSVPAVCPSSVAA